MADARMLRPNGETTELKSAITDRWRSSGRRCSRAVKVGRVNGQKGVVVGAKQFELVVNVAGAEFDAGI